MDGKQMNSNESNQLLTLIAELNELSAINSARAKELLIKSSKLALTSKTQLALLTELVNK
jgi:hypothetical protein